MLDDLWPRLNTTIWAKPNRPTTKNLLTTFCVHEVKLRIISNCEKPRKSEREIEKKAHGQTYIEKLIAKFTRMNEARERAKWRRREKTKITHQKKEILTTKIVEITMNSVRSEGVWPQHISTRSFMVYILDLSSFGWCCSLKKIRCLRYFFYLVGSTFSTRTIWML